MEFRYDHSCSGEESSSLSAVGINLTDSLGVVYCDWFFFCDEHSVWPIAFQRGKENSSADFKAIGTENMYLNKVLK